MIRFIDKPIYGLGLVIILCAYLFFFQSGKMALTDPDETFYAQTAKEMLNRHEWSTPYLYGKPQFEKPILFYSLVEASYKIFGISEFSARLPSVVFGLIGVIAIYLLGSLLFNNRAGIFAAIILATSVEYIIISRACVTDMVLFTFMLLGALFFFYGHLKEKSFYYLLSSAAFALATLTKGPIAIILPAAIFVAYFIFTKNYKAFKKIPFIPAILVFLVIAMPWYIVMYKMHGKNFIDMFFGFHNITRFLESEHAIGSQFYYNIPIVLGGFFPWSVFLPFGFWYVWKKAFSKERKEKASHVFILAWFFVIFTFFSVSSTKLPTYVFPSFMALALIVGVLWDDFLKANAQTAVIKSMELSYYSLLIIAVLGAIGALVYIKIDYPVILPGVAASIIFLLFGFAISFIAFINKKPEWTFFLIVYAVILFLYPLNKLVLPEIERYETSKEAALKLLTMMKGDEKLGAESNYLAGLAFYTNKVPVDLDQHDRMVKFLRSKERVWCVLKEKNHRQLYELDTKPIYHEPSYMVYKLGKRAIVTNRVPDDGMYMIKRERIK